ncbi:MAG: TonB-dependent receptor domain-containing protein [Chitinophagaceae bacterium]
MRKFIYTIRRAGFFAFLMFTFQWTIAQSSSAIKGNVKDANGSPLSSASVTIEGQRGGTLTDANGNYLLKVKAGTYTLVVTYVGATPQRYMVTVGTGQTVEQNANINVASDLTDVVVVGSRSRVPRSKLNTVVPVDVINAREIKQFAQADVTQMLTYVAPSFQSSRQTVSDGTDHIDPAGLRGLGPDQTLVLINGKRRHNSALVNINGSVGRGSVGTDLNTIPAAAIERIEVLRDGAAAQYGSDAIAGVINIVLKKNYKGLNISGMLGENFTNMPYAGGVKIQDGLNRQFDFSGGWGWKNGAYVNVSGQWLQRDNTNRSGLDNIPLIYTGNGGGLPGTAAVPAGITSNDYYRWLIDLDKGVVSQRGYNRRNIVAGNSSNTNTGVFVNAGVPISKNINFYLTTGYSQRNGDASGFSRNPNSWSQQPVLANGQRFYYDGFLPVINTRIIDYSVSAGLNFKAGAWDLDISNTRGENSLRYDISNSGNSSLPATNAVQTKFYAGSLGFLQNTINVDLDRKVELGGSRTLNVAFGGEYRYERFTIAQGEANSYINGGRQFQPDPIPPYPGTSGFFTFSPGTAVSGSQVFPGFQPADAVNANRNMYAFYTDLELRTRKFVLGGALRYETYDELQFNYSNLSGKLAARYEITDKIAVRASASTGFRAPSLHQRYFQNTSTQFVAGLPSQALTANNYNPIVRKAFGVESLSPETSKSLTAGVVGNISRNTSLTIDAYFIRIDDRIVLSSQFNRSNPLIGSILTSNGVDPTINALQFWTNAVNTETKGIDMVITHRFRLGAGNATLSFAGNYNNNTVVGSILTNSVIDDPINNPSTNDATKNPVNDLRTALFDRQQRSRIEVGQPKTKLNFTFNYDLRKYSVLLRTVRFGEITALNPADPASRNAATGAYWNDVGLGTDQTFSAKWTTDFVLTYKACPGMNISVGANNLFDVYPDRIFVDPRNDPNAYYNAPIASALGVNKTSGGHSAGRDLSNRGRFLYSANQFGFNGRFMFARISLDIFELGKCVKVPVKIVPPPPPPPPVVPKDSDGDGVADELDGCPTVAGPKVLNGCPDKDGDGVADKDDVCPDVAGPKAFAGCPDRDGDGIQDSKDKCPDTYGLSRYEGCPIPDKDNDGVADDEDRCPETAGPVANFGCPRLEEMNFNAKNVTFLTGSSKLTKQATKELDELVAIMNKYPKLAINVDGHTDNTGKKEKNMALSQSRADEVKKYLSSKGIDADRLSATGYGSEKGVGDNTSANGRAQNRRVEFSVRN